MHKNRVIVLAGPSAVGKTTVMKHMLSCYPELEFVHSATTRAPRGDGFDSEYIYLTEAEFRAHIERSEMLEYTEFGGNLYGTPRSEIDRIAEIGKIPLLILDINGVESLKKGSFGFSTFSVYITAEQSILDERLRARAEADGFSERAMSTLKRRMEQNRRDIAKIAENAELFDVVLKNDNISECAAAIMAAFNS